MRLGYCRGDGTGTDGGSQGRVGEKRVGLEVRVVFWGTRGRVQDLQRDGPYKLVGKVDIKRQFYDA